MQWHATTAVARLMSTTTGSPTLLAVVVFGLANLYSRLPQIAVDAVPLFLGQQFAGALELRNRLGEVAPVVVDLAGRAETGGRRRLQVVSEKCFS